MHAFDNEEHKQRELAELETTREDLGRMPAESMKDEIEHLFATLRLAEEACKHGWYSIFTCHKATIAAGMDLIFARLSSDF
ncbi:hypothetical protein PFISCL1PPCAC_7769 [Pristionchus fissidentatus]|uniref:Uncharacterized protein n=1 Tax=Pristionchus fissidentatus TaxID=1538716 RepID=A0AAV5VCM2_9BILA|nr:hypothetical protein PFISCL1PPCAC_7769 [Pristionchus fissidentatus]